MNMSFSDTIVSIVVLVVSIGYILWYFLIDGKIQNKKEKEKMTSTKKMMIEKVFKNEKNKM